MIWVPGQIRAGKMGDYLGVWGRELLGSKVDQKRPLVMCTVPAEKCLDHSARVM